MGLLFVSVVGSGVIVNSGGVFVLIGMVFMGVMVGVLMLDMFVNGVISLVFIDGGSVMFVIGLVFVVCGGMVDIVVCNGMVVMVGNGMLLNFVNGSNVMFSVLVVNFVGDIVLDVLSIGNVFFVNGIMLIGKIDLVVLIVDGMSMWCMMGSLVLSSLINVGFVVFVVLIGLLMLMGSYKMLMIGGYVGNGGMIVLNMYFGVDVLLIDWLIVNGGVVIGMIGLKIVNMVGVGV